MDPSLMVQQGPNPGERFAAAFQQGQQTREQNMAKAAMAALVRDPNNQKALEALASVDPGSAQQFQHQRAQMAHDQLAQHQESIKAAAQIIQRVKASNPQMPDEQVYAIAHGAAIQAGIPGAELAPPTYNKQYFDGLLYMADPEKGQQDRIITPQPGGGAWSMGQDGTLKQLIAPNDGSQPSGAPVGGLAPGTVVADPRIQGGATGAAPSPHFP